MELGAKPIILGDSVFRDPSKAFFRRGETPERSLCCHCSRYECPVTGLVWVLNPISFDRKSWESRKGKSVCIRSNLFGTLEG
jgi:hypothetical protein